MQVEHKTEKGTVLFVKVPDGAYNFSNNMQPNQLDYYTDIPFNGSKLTFSECIILPKVDWQLIGLTSEVTEEIAIGMVDDEIDWGHKTGYVDYTNRSTVCGFSSLESFESLIKFKNIKHRSVVLFKPNEK